MGTPTCQPPADGARRRLEIVNYRHYDPEARSVDFRR
jgi:hypothetical protein